MASNEMAEDQVNAIQLPDGAGAMPSEAEMNSSFAAVEALLKQAQTAVQSATDAFQPTRAAILLPASHVPQQLVNEQVPGMSNSLDGLPPSSLPLPVLPPPTTSLGHYLASRVLPVPKGKSQGARGRGQGQQGDIRRSSIVDLYTPHVLPSSLALPVSTQVSWGIGLGAPSALQETGTAQEGGNVYEPPGYTLAQSMSDADLSYLSSDWEPSAGLLAGLRDAPLPLHHAVEGPASEGAPGQQVPPFPRVEDTRHTQGTAQQGADKTTSVRSVSDRMQRRVSVGSARQGTGLAAAQAGLSAARARAEALLAMLEGEQGMPSKPPLPNHSASRPVPDRAVPTASSSSASSSSSLARSIAHSLAQLPTAQDMQAVASSARAMHSARAVVPLLPPAPPSAHRPGLQAGDRAALARARGLAAEATQRSAQLVQQLQAESGHDSSFVEQHGAGMDPSPAPLPSALLHLSMQIAEAQERVQEAAREVKEALQDGSRSHAAWHVGRDVVSPPSTPPRAAHPAAPPITASPSSSLPSAITRTSSRAGSRSLSTGRTLSQGVRGAASQQSTPARASVQSVLRARGATTYAHAYGGGGEQGQGQADVSRRSSADTGSTGTTELLQAIATGQQLPPRHDRRRSSAGSSSRPSWRWPGHAPGSTPPHPHPHSLTRAGEVTGGIGKPVVMQIGRAGPAARSLPLRPAASAVGSTHHPPARGRGSTRTAASWQVSAYHRQWKTETGVPVSPPRSRGTGGSHDLGDG